MAEPPRRRTSRDPREAAEPAFRKATAPPPPRRNEGRTSRRQGAGDAPHRPRRARLLPEGRPRLAGPHGRGAPAGGGWSAAPRPHPGRQAQRLERRVGPAPLPSDLRSGSLVSFAGHSRSCDEKIARLARVCGAGYYRFAGRVAISSPMMVDERFRFEPGGRGMRPRPPASPAHTIRMSPPSRSGAPLRMAISLAAFRRRRPCRRRACRSPPCR